jgi:glutathione S-transferase
MIKLVIGDKNLSTWSMRAWLVLKQSGLTFEEVMIPLDGPDTKKSLQTFSPSQKVPCLIHNDLKVWDSLAISEYIAELTPDKNLWPADSTQRALARAYAAEIHSSFQSMRSQLSMDIRLQMNIRHLAAQTISEIERILTLWKNALEKSKGPFLFGEFGIVDAFYAPVVFRFLSYGIQISSEPVKKYMKNIQEFESVKTWVKAALDEKPPAIEFK